VHHGHGDHPLDGLAVGLGAEGAVEGGAVGVVGDLHRLPGQQHPAAEPDARWHDEAVGLVAEAAHEVAEDEVAVVVELTDPGDVDADLVGQPAEDRAERCAPVEQVQELGVVVVQIQEYVGVRPPGHSTATGHQLHGTWGRQPPLGRQPTHGPMVHERRALAHLQLTVSDRR
jgi:hypothetical protein